MDGFHQADCQNPCLCVHWYHLAQSPHSVFPLWMVPLYHGNASRFHHRIRKLKPSIFTIAANLLCQRDILCSNRSLQAWYCAASMTPVASIRSAQSCKVSTVMEMRSSSSWMKMKSVSSSSLMTPSAVISMRRSLYYRVVVIRAPLQGLVLHCKGCCGLVCRSYHKMVRERFQPQPFAVLLIS